MKHNNPFYYEEKPEFCVNCGKHFETKTDFNYNHRTGEKISEIILQCPKCKQQVRKAP